MGLQKRLTIFTVALVTLLSGLLGGFLIKQDFDGAINKIRTELIYIQSSVDQTQQDKVTTAVALARSAPIQVSVGLVDENGNFTAILEPDEPLSKKIDIYVDIEGGSQLLLSASTSNELDRRNSSVINLFVFLLSIIALSIIILRLVIARDVARERRAIEMAEHLKSENEKRTALLEFAGDASHELRTPLTVIKGYLELGEKSRDVISSPETIGRMKREVDRMERTISSLLQVFEIDAIPDQELRVQNIAPLLNEAVNTFIAINPMREVSCEIDSNIELSITEPLLNAVIGNALSNISRHTQENAPVSFSAKKLNGEVLIKIEDGGPGIADRLSEDSIQLFTRFDKSRSRQNGGSGLGLSIIFSAVKKLGGEINLGRSNLGGLAINIRIPISKN